MGINSLFNIATTGITMSRVAIEVTSENISNVNTDGYSRQTVAFKTGPTNNANGFPLGTGVQLAAVQRNHDELLQLQIVDGNSANGESSVKETALDQIEPFFNELSTEGLGQSVQDFFDSWQDLSTNASGTAERQTVLARSQTLVDTFHRMSTNLGDSLKNADSTLDGITRSITDSAKSIASLNEQILQTERLGGNANELRDQRDYQILELATKVGVSYSEQSDGTMTVSLPGGEKLVEGNGYAAVTTQDDSSTGLNRIMFTPIGGGAATDVTSTIGGTDNSQGEIGGTLQVRDEIVPGYLARLDEMANQLVTAVNTQHSAGYGLDGSQNSFFDPAGTTSAAISINPALTADKIAAAGQDPTSAFSGPGDNENALALAQLKNASLTFTVDGTPTKTTVASYYNALVSKVGVDAQNAANTTSQNESFLKQLNTLRESHSGVSLDEELTNLIKYQRAFEASARMITAASDMLDTVLGMIR
jgi:flagellar hook-associated protein 1 FlgK